MDLCISKHVVAKRVITVAALAEKLESKENKCMCGIIGFTGQRQAAPLLLEGLKKLEYRGYDSAGVAVQGSEAIYLEKTSGLVENLVRLTNDGADMPGTCGIAHTRWATHGAPTSENAHPHISSDGRFAVVHNGIVENYAQLRDELIDEGYEFASQTDTEVIAHLLCKYNNGDPKKAVLHAVARLEGSYALGVIYVDAPGTLYAFREASPLILGLGVDENWFASDVTALISHTKSVIYLEDGELAELSPEHVTVWDSTGQELHKEVSRIAWDMEAAEKGGYDHFMLKEIMEQPRAVSQTVEPRIRDGRISLDDFDMTEEELRSIKRIVITACGSAYYAGCVGSDVIEALCRVPVTAELASELRYSDPIIDEHTLLLVLSQSGETADTIAALKECKERGAKTLAIVNVVGSAVAKLADHVIYTHAGPEIAVATTKGYTTQVAVLNMFAIWAADKLGNLSADRYAALVEGVRGIPAAIQRAIDLNPHVADLASTYYDNNSLFFIGRGLDYAVSLEGSLKLKEISYIHSEAYAAGELKHGTIALIDQGRPVVALACQESLFDKMMSAVQQVKARGAKVLAVAIEGNRKIFAESDDVLFVPAGDPLLAPAVEIVPLQLFAYHIAKVKGCDIDKPRNLAKSVTVE